MVLASSLASVIRNKVFQVKDEASISGPPVTKTDILLASARPADSKVWLSADEVDGSHFSMAAVLDSIGPCQAFHPCSRRRPSRSRSEPLTVVVGDGMPGPRQGPTRQLQACDRDAAPRPQPITIGLTQSGRHPTEPTLPPSCSLLTPILAPPLQSRPWGWYRLHQFTHIGSGESIGRRALCPAWNEARLIYHIMFPLSRPTARRGSSPADAPLSPRFSLVLHGSFRSF